MSAPSARATLRRNAARGVYDLDVIKAILDAEMVCHVAYVEAGEPRMIPTLYMRRGEEVFLHGNRQSALLKHMAQGGLVTLSVMLVDGVVVARSGFHCSMNYRAVTLYGEGRLVEGEEHREVLDAFVDVLIPGHLEAVREPTRQELAATTAVALPISECVAKVRAGDPIDDAGDLDASAWAGVLPISRQMGQPIAAADLKSGVELPGYLAGYLYPDSRDG